MSAATVGDIPIALFVKKAENVLSEKFLIVEFWYSAGPVVRERDCFGTTLLARGGFELIVISA